MFTTAIKLGILIWGFIGTAVCGTHYVIAL